MVVVATAVVVGPALVVAPAAAAAGAAVAVPALAGVAEAQQSPTTTAASGATTSAGPTTTAAPTTTTTAPPSKPQAEDLVVLSFANSVELGLVAIYTQALASGRLSADNAKIVTRFQAHHRDHAQSFAGMGGKVITNIANQSLVSAYTTRIQAASSEQALLQVLLELETAMASSYTGSISSLVATDPVYLVASILPTESRHAVVYGEKLGAPTDAYLPPFESTSGGITPAQYPIVES